LKKDTTVRKSPRPAESRTKTTAGESAKCVTTSESVTTATDKSVSSTSAAKSVTAASAPVTAASATLRKGGRGHQR
jgi:hypothetical protein